MLKKLIDKYNIHLIIFLFFLSACVSNEVKNTEEYLQWLNNEENGLVKVKYINGMEVKIKYLPADYLAFQELNDMKWYTENQKDSIIKIYSDNETFIMTIGPDKRKKENGDVMLKGINNYKEYKGRFLTMNFDMSEFIKMEIGNKIYKPVLSNMENTYGLEESRNIIFVFSPGKEKDKILSNSDEIDLKYSDEMFGLGTNHFVFSKKWIDNLPKFPFLFKNI
jgi:hypothetical protein